MKSDKVLDEFNSFLFQHTSKISLDDIMEAQRKKDDELNEKKVKSPYTKEYKEKFNFMPIIYIILGLMAFIGILYLILSHINTVPKRVDELKGVEIYELA